jgi:hypothetical protein
VDSAARPGIGDPPAELSSEMIAGLGALLCLLHGLPGTMERKARDEALNAALNAALAPMAKAATELGASRTNIEILISTSSPTPPAFCCCCIPDAFAFSARGPRH